MCLLRLALAEVRRKQGEWSRADSAMLDMLSADATSVAELTGVADAASLCHPDSDYFTTANHRNPIGNRPLIRSTWKHATL